MTCWFMSCRRGVKLGVRSGPLTVIFSFCIIHQGCRVCQGTVHHQKAPFRQLPIKKLYLNSGCEHFMQTFCEHVPRDSSFHICPHTTGSLPLSTSCSFNAWEVRKGTPVFTHSKWVNLSSWACALAVPFSPVGHRFRSSSSFDWHFQNLYWGLPYLLRKGLEVKYSSKKSTRSSFRVTMSTHLSLNSRGGKGFRTKVPSLFHLKTSLLQKSQKVKPDPKMGFGKTLPGYSRVLTPNIANSPNEDSKLPQNQPMSPSEILYEGLF